MDNFVIEIKIKQKGNGDKYEPVILDTGFTDPISAITKANHTLERKFGIRDKFEIVKEHGGRKRIHAE